MSNINYKFFEEYKRADKLCGDMYGTTQGISAYIEDMEANYSLGARSFPDWQSFYKELKHLRYLRNYLAHEGSFEEDVCTSSDVRLITNFRYDVMEGSDMLTVLNRARRSKASSAAYSLNQEPTPAKQKKQKYVDDTTYVYKRKRKKKRRHGFIKGLIKFAVVVTILAIIAYFLYKYGIIDWIIDEVRYLYNRIVS